MIKRVARAICAAHVRDPDLYDGDYYMWEHYVDQAKAAIEAMKEPTDEMLNAAWPLAAANECAGEIYEVMINAALEEKSNHH